MRLIDILNKIVNDEELPEVIMIFGHKFRYDKIVKTYRSFIDNTPIGEMFILEYCLGFRVKIIEENKTPEKLEIQRLNNIINELEKYLEQQWLEWKDDFNDEIVAMAKEDKEILNKLRKLKEKSYYENK